MREKLKKKIMSFLLPVQYFLLGLGCGICLVGGLMLSPNIAAASIGIGMTFILLAVSVRYAHCELSYCPITIPPK